LVVANLEPRVLTAQSEALAAVASRAKRLLLTGFLTTQERAIRQPFERAGYTVKGRERKQGWLLLSFVPPSSSPRSVSPRSRARDTR
jgi:ribosomal protein L11 methylase PrmA